MNFGLVNASNNLPEWQAAKLTFFACYKDLLFRTYKKDLVLRGALPIAFVAEAPLKGVPFSGFWYTTV